MEAYTLTVSTININLRFCVAAATALIDVDGLTAEEIAKKSMKIAADLCIYTNHNTTMEILKNEEAK